LSLKLDFSFTCFLKLDYLWKIVESLTFVDTENAGSIQTKKKFLRS